MVHCCRPALVVVRPGSGGDVRHFLEVLQCPVVGILGVFDTDGLQAGNATAEIVADGGVRIATSDGDPSNIATAHTAGYQRTIIHAFTCATTNTDPAYRPSTSL